MKKTLLVGAAALALAGCAAGPYYDGYGYGPSYDSGYGGPAYYYDYGPSIGLGYYYYDGDGNRHWHDGHDGNWRGDRNWNGGDQRWDRGPQGTHQWRGPMDSRGGETVGTPSQHGETGNEAGMGPAVGGGYNHQ